MTAREAGRSEPSSSQSRAAEQRTENERPASRAVRKRVYLAGPYTKGDVAVNVRTAIEAASELMDNGFAPFLPHLSHFWHLVNPRPYEDWLALDFAWIPSCDAMLRLPGESPGADRECDLALSLGIPVFFNLPALLKSLAA